MTSPFLIAAEQAGAQLVREPRLVAGVQKHRWRIVNAPEGTELAKAGYPTKKGAAKAFCKLNGIEVKTS